MLHQSLSRWFFSEEVDKLWMHAPEFLQQFIFAVAARDARGWVVATQRLGQRGSCGHGLEAPEVPAPADDVTGARHAHVTEVFCQLGERHLSAEQVAKRLVDEVRAYQRSSGALGPHLADQWMLPLALAVWRSGQAARYTCTEVTQHTATNAQTIALGLPVRVQITPVERAMHVEIAPA